MVGFDATIGPDAATALANARERFTTEITYRSMYDEPFVCRGLGPAKERRYRDMPGPLHAPPLADPLSVPVPRVGVGEGSRVKARYAVWAIIGQPEYRRSGVGFQPLSQEWSAP